ncbi:response regulator [Microbacterium sp. HD4P20]|uniref:response regulator n=1 Tax=Microbacterium sp. HD4P20 TaxID=2864874 RepID=UPI001C63DD77|nr:response regulator [Microbacterium sp. HD4P20]MCP2638162.1 response regulator [Microbacterium sp. HD4P20]
MSPSIRVVVVDDEPAVARLHTRFMSSYEGCEVVAIAGTGAEAIAAIQELEPDLVLLDLYLPGMSGLDVLRAVRAGSQRQPEIIALTAARDFDSVRVARLAGVRHYLVKPFSARDLYARVDAIARELAARPAGTLRQEDIDSFIGGATAAPPLPKGLSVETLDAVRRAIDESPWSTATEVGDRIGISRVTSRRYLEHLAHTGAVVRRLDYATAGRPSAQYAPAPRP